MFSKEQIRIAYQYFLGRDPENDDVLNDLAINVKNLEQLRSHFINSSEFLGGVNKILGDQQNIRVNIAFQPYIPVEINVSPENLKKLFSRALAKWHELGLSEPFWSVLTHDHYKLHSFDFFRDQFFISGKSSAELFFASLRRNNLDFKNFSSCLDFGCGVGRVTRFLSESFKNVIGVDISSTHITHACKFLEENNIRNVDLICVSNLELFADIPNIDCIFSIITLQHNPPPIAALILRKLLKKLNADGVAFFQVLTYKSGYLFEVSRYLDAEQSRDLEMHCLPQAEIFKIINQENCNCLEVREDGMTSDGQYMISNSFLVQKQ
jgi:2-polyprenyl-3-methyl-5-hydroxy-6-metoxy-1,4-benzoquinol methylase